MAHPIYFSTYYLPGPILNTLHVLAHLILTRTLVRHHTHTHTHTYTHRGGNQGTERLSNLPNVLQPLRVGVRIRTLAAWLPSGCILMSQVLG